MKKKLFFAVIIIFAAIPVFAQNGAEITFNIGNVGIGANFPLGSVYDIETHFSLVSFGIEEKTTNLGFVFCPFVYTSWTTSDDSDGIFNMSYEGISLFNLNLYWNVLSVRNFYLGPFTSINYIFIDKVVYWDRYVFTAGIQMGMRLSFKNFEYNLFTCEAGYRNINGTGKYYISGKVDLLTLFTSILFGALISD